MSKIWLMLTLFAAGIAGAQEPAPFRDEIQAFKKADSARFPSPGQVLFIGSSSFRMWKDVQAYFPGHRILNRGFGGAALPDLIHYAKDIVRPYKPKQIVIYCGENDLASSDTVTAQGVLKRFEILFYLLRKYCPKVPVVFVSIKPSPSRRHLMPKMVEANRLIRHFLSKRTRTTFVDIYHKMLDAGGSPRAELFQEDMLHMNANGYAIWQKALAPHLLK